MLRFTVQRNGGRNGRKSDFRLQREQFDTLAWAKDGETGVFLSILLAVFYSHAAVLEMSS